MSSASASTDDGGMAAMHGAVLFYSESCYGVFDAIGWEEAKKVADIAGQFFQENAPYKDKKGNYPQTELPHFGKKSVIFCIALGSAFLVWANKGKDLPASPLLAAAHDGYKLHYMGCGEPNLAGGGW